MTFFFDAHFARRLVACLREAGIVAIHVSEQFGDGVPDPAWIEEAGRRGWIVMTGDLRIRTRDVERTALTQAGVTVFFVRPNVMHHRDAIHQVAWFCTHHDAIVAAVNAARPGTHFLIGVQGKPKRL